VVCDEEPGLFVDGIMEVNLMEADQEKEDPGENCPNFLEDCPAASGTAQRPPNGTRNHKRWTGKKSKSKSAHKFQGGEKDEENDMKEDLERIVLREAPESTKFVNCTFAGFGLLRPLGICVEGRVTTVEGHEGSKRPVRWTGLSIFECEGEPTTHIDGDKGCGELGSQTCLESGFELNIDVQDKGVTLI
jgi:hypothetical protein